MWNWRDRTLGVFQFAPALEGRFKLQLDFCKFLRDALYVCKTGLIEIGPGHDGSQTRYLLLELFNLHWQTLEFALLLVGKFALFYGRLISAG